MAVVKEYKNGNCSIRIHDDNICPPKEAEEIIHRVSAMILQEEARKNAEDKCGKEREKIKNQKKDSGLRNCQNH